MATLARPLPPGSQARDVPFVVPLLAKKETELTPQQIAAIAIAISEQVACESQIESPSIWRLQSRLSSVIRL